MEFDLLSTVEYGGCSAKIPATLLEKALLSIPKIKDSNLLVDIDTHDDAGVYKISEDTALIFTTDFFPPICSDPYDFGQIAASNSLSDVYAMGGEPFLALNIAMFPASKIPLSVYTRILEGAASMATQAKTLIIGGHTIDDYPPKFGLAVIGKVHPEKVITNAGLKPGQVLVLTKPLGMGVVVAGKRLQMVKESTYTEALKWMKVLNNQVDILQRFGITGATDITGFGLLGHALKMAKASKVRITINSKIVPSLPEALSLIDSGCIPGAAFRNVEYAEGKLAIKSCDFNHKMLLADAQTSGGLLIGVNEDKAIDLVAQLKQVGLNYTSIIGKVSNNDGSHNDLVILD